MTGIIAYLRASSIDPAASKKALADQQFKLSEWLDGQPYELLERFIEIEGNYEARPQLAAAVAACKLFGVPLLIVSTQPIGVGAPFGPRIASVPVIVLPQPRRMPPQTIPCPRSRHDEVHLQVGRAREGLLPLYLCNPNPTALEHVQVHGGGLHVGTEKLTRTYPTERSISRIEAETCSLLEERDVNLEGEFLDCLRLTFCQDGVWRKGSVLLGDLLDRSRPIHVKFDP